MDHKEYIQEQKARAVEIASGMLDGSVHYLEGVLSLYALCHKLDLPLEDPDFMALSEIASEIDHLPIGSQREYWSKEALLRHEQEIQETIEWAKQVSLVQCQSLVKRFSA